MRTTLDIDDDVLAAAKELARHEGATAGQIVSRLLRRSLTGLDTSTATLARTQSVAGFTPFAPRTEVITTQSDVDALRDAEGV